jgi:hypothetical protein
MRSARPVAGILVAALAALVGTAPRAEDALPYPAGESEQVIDGRRVSLRLPGTAPKGGGWGLVLALGGTLEDLSALSADEYVVCRASPRVDAAGKMWSGGETKELWALVNHLTKALPVDPHRLHAVGIDEGVHTIFGPTAFGDGARFASATFFRSHHRGGAVAKRAKKELGVLAFEWTPDHGDGIGKLRDQVGDKVRSLELRDDPAGLAGPYFPWWIRTMEGRFVPGEDLSFPWIDDLDGLDALQRLIQQRQTGAFVHVFSKEDMASAAAKALHLETFLDERVRGAGRALLAVELDRSTRAGLAQALGVQTTPTIVVLRKDGTEAARFEGDAKPLALAKALEAVRKR